MSGDMTLVREGGLGGLGWRKGMRAVHSAIESVG